MTDPTKTIYQNRPNASKRSEDPQQAENEPNFTYQNVEAKRRSAYGGQNEPNFTPKKYLFLINSSDLLLIFPPKARTFPLIYPSKADFYPEITKKTRTFRRFFQLLDQNTLKSMYNKDLHKYFTPKYPCIMRLGSCVVSILLCKTNPISTTERPATRLRRAQSSRDERRKYAKRTQFALKRP